MQTRQLAEFLSAEGVAVKLIAVNPPYKPRWIRNMRGLRAIFRLFPYLLRLWKIAGDAQIVHVMANSGWSWHLFATPAIWIGALRGTPVLVNYRGGAADDFLRREIRWVAPSLRRASRIVVPSAYLRDVFLRFGIATEMIPNSVDMTLFQPGESARASGRGMPHLLVARHLEAIYDVGTAIKAFHLLRTSFPEAELTLAGSGPELAALQGLVETLGLTGAVHFPGNLEKERMAELYRHADILLNPSLEDNMPNSLLEAMASGLPIVSTDAGGIPLMITHEDNGLLVARGDPQGMSQAARRILQDERLRARLIRSGIDRARRHAWPAVKVAWLTTYGELLRN